MLDTERALYRQTLSVEGAQFKPGGIHLPRDCFLFVVFVKKCQLGFLNLFIKAFARISPRQLASRPFNFIALSNTFTLRNNKSYIASVTSSKKGKLKNSHYNIIFRQESWVVS